MALFVGTKAVFRSLDEIKNDRNQDIEFQKRAWGSSGDLEQQQRSMPNYSRPHYPSYPNHIQGYKGRAYTPPPSIAKSIANAFLRFCQFVFALTVAGLYGRDLHLACDKNVYLDAKWVFAEIVAALAAATSAGYLLIWCCVRRLARPALTSYYSMHFPLWLWEMFLCVIWLTLFGIFGKMYLPEHPEGDLDIVRMKHAVWVDLVNLLLWTATMIWSGLRWWQGRVRKDGDSSEMKNEGFDFNDGAGGRAATPPAASGAASVPKMVAPLAMPAPTPYQTPRADPRDAPQHDISPLVSRQNSGANSNANTEERSVSPL
uniref:DNA-binding protein RHL1 n=1 Tax=Talaromyces marneffei PM1 TaxID=1077442 RepID=A0A093X8R5_TALMA